VRTDQLHCSPRAKSCGTPTPDEGTRPPARMPSVFPSQVRTRRILSAPSMAFDPSSVDSSALKARVAELRRFL
jgi:hypothetical protein